ncbi:SWIM zinc finger family protein [Streptomyces sp. NPDC017673]|uniref:SWIM zinc finger family protein n=1 Tax=unclassified Streptomyces TaxID=2593676 RepID=UPI00378913B0
MGRRPGDVARQALRAARREAEALRAQTAEPGRERRTPGRSATATPGTSPAPGRRTSAARAKAAQDMRHYLATAFRMPTWEETVEEPEEHDPTKPTEPAPSTSASAASPSGSEPAYPVSAAQAPVPAPEPSAAAPESSAPAPSPEVGGTTPKDPLTGSASPDPASEPVSAPSATGVPVAPAEASRPTPSALSAPKPTPAPSADTPARPAPAGPFARWTPAARPTPAGGASVQAGPSEPSTTGTPPTPAGGASVQAGPAERPAHRATGASPTPAGGASAQAGPSEPSTTGTPPGPAGSSAHHAIGTRPTPAAPRVPTTMATPHRDTELRRTFPAFAPRETGGNGPFAGTWWGNAWVGALEQGALDVKRLARGRGYADQGHVDAITVTPGLVLAYVRGSRPRPYRVQVRLRTLEDEDWERFLDAAADRPGNIAALLDKELPQSLADCGVPLLPGPGDLAPRCSCPDAGHPCKHAAALCYQTARLLDADPFVLLLLRGRGEKELLDALSRRSAARAARAAQERQPQALPGVSAADALAPRELPPPPPPLPVPPHPEQPPAYPSAPGGPDPFALDQLATDAAARAHALLATGRDPVGELTLWQDAVRLAAARPGSGLTAATRTLYATLADAAQRTPADLARAVAAWRQGGSAGLAALEEPWDPPAGRFDRARPLLLAADLPAFRPWRNRLTHPRGHVQLRLGRDGLWYAYESDPGQDDWWPRGTPDLDPVGALTGLGRPDDAV